MSRRRGPSASERSTEIVVRQLRSIHAWQQLLRDEHTASTRLAGASREQLLLASRREQALALEASSLRDRCTATGHASPVSPRAVLIHRQDWLTDKLAAGLVALGIDVIATVSDGAVGCGIAIAEAPELVFLEASLPSMSGPEVIRRIVHCSPVTAVGAQVPHRPDRAALEALGATAVWTRQTPPAALLTGLIALLQSQPTDQAHPL